MKTKTLVPFMAAAAALFLTGCGPSLVSVHPLYTEQDAAADLPLEGLWTDSDAKEIYKVTASEKAFEIAGDTEPLTMHLVKLGDYRFLDIEPKEVPDLAVRGHMFMKVWMEGGELCFAIFGTDWLAGQLAMEHLPYLRTPDKTALLGLPTDDLRKLVQKYAAEPKAFDSEVGRLHRVR